MFRVDWGILPSYVGIVVSHYKWFPIKQTSMMEKQERIVWLNRFQEVIHGKKHKQKILVNRVLAVVSKRYAHCWVRKISEFWDMSMMYCWPLPVLLLERDTIVFLFQTISNVFDVICCQLIWNVLYIYVLVYATGIFSFQNGSRMASILNLVCLLCLACCIGILRRFCFSRGWGIDQPKFSQDKSRVVTVFRPGIRLVCFQ